MSAAGAFWWRVYVDRPQRLGLQQRMAKFHCSEPAATIRNRGELSISIHVLLPGHFPQPAAGRLVGASAEQDGELDAARSASPREASLLEKREKWGTQISSWVAQSTERRARSSDPGVRHRTAAFGGVHRGHLRLQRRFQPEAENRTGR